MISIMIFSLFKIIYGINMSNIIRIALGSHIASVGEIVEGLDKIF